MTSWGLLRRIGLLGSLLSTVAVGLGEFAWADHTPAPTTVTLPGSLQSELGCLGDWQPDCVATQLFDGDSDGIFTYATSAIPEGSYECKIALGLTWDLNYGADGVYNGANIPFIVPAGGALVTISWNSMTLVPTVTVGGVVAVEGRDWGHLKASYR